MPAGDASCFLRAWARRSVQLIVFLCGTPATDPRTDALWPGLHGRHILCDLCILTPLSLEHSFYQPPLLLLLRPPPPRLDPSHLVVLTPTLCTPPSPPPPSLLLRKACTRPGSLTSQSTQGNERTLCTPLCMAPSWISLILCDHPPLFCLVHTLSLYPLSLHLSLFFSRSLALVVSALA